MRSRSILSSSVDPVLQGSIPTWFPSAPSIRFHSPPLFSATRHSPFVRLPGSEDWLYSLAPRLNANQRDQRSMDIAKEIFNYNKR